MSTSNARTVPIDEAVGILGVSRRTIERRLAKGELAGRRDGRAWLVELPATAPTEVEELRARVVELTANVKQLTATDGQTHARLAELEKALAVAEARLESAEAERTYLRQALAASLTLSQKLLPERTESNRPWWRVFSR